MNKKYLHKVNSLFGRKLYTTYHSCLHKVAILIVLSVSSIIPMQIKAQNVNCKYQFTDDRAIRINTPADVKNKRREIIHAIWDTDHIPNRSNVNVTPNSQSPLFPNPIISRVDKIEIPVESLDSIKDLAYLFVPVKRNNRLVLFCPGHLCNIKDSKAKVSYGVEAAITGLLSAGFDVLSVYMPHVSESNCDLNHCKIYNTNLGIINPKPTFGLRLFLEPTIVSLNYLLKQNKYKNVNMVGLSGGGWTTNLIAAVDTRIKLSFCVAGSIPLCYWFGDSRGDIEQFLPQLYRDISGYPDIYVLDSCGKGRMLTQIFNRNDNCCFGEKQHDPKRDYVLDLNSLRKNLKEKLESLKCRDHYRLVIDELAPSHQISAFALDSVILPGLNGMY